MVIVEERTADGAISRRTSFQGGFPQPSSRPNSGTVAAWGDRLTDNDMLPRDAGNDGWQSDPRINKPFIKDHNQNLLPPHDRSPCRSKGLEVNREAAERKKAEEEAKRKAEEQKRKEEEAKRKAEEEAKRKAALAAALKQANELIAAARWPQVGCRPPSRVVQGAVTAGSNASSAAGVAEGAAQRARGAVGTARSACAQWS